MYIFIVTLLLIWFLVNLWCKKWNRQDKVFFSFLYSAVAALACCSAVAILRDIRCIETARVNCEQRIYSLRNLDTVSGAFFLGSGGIGYTEYYAMFIADNRGGLYRVTVNANEANIFQTDSGQHPRLFWQQVYYKPNPWLIIWPKIQWMQNTRYDIIVPTNTVIEQYRLN
jgi:hypothetical protein